MNIEDLTLKQIKELSKINTSTPPPMDVGKSYLIRTVTNYFVGEIKSIDGNWVTLSDASWVASTGRYAECLESGEFGEAESYTDDAVINSGSFVDFTLWKHSLPKVAK